MARKSIVKILSIMLTIGMLTFVLSACNSNPNPSPSSGGVEIGEAPEWLNTDSMLPIVKEDHDPITLTAACVTRAGFTQSPEDHWIWKWWKKYGNLNIEPTYYSESSWGEQKALLFSSGRMPDFFMYCSWSPSEMVLYGQDQQLFLPVDDYIKEYAPNLQALREGDFANSFAQATCPDGRMYGIPNLIQEWLELETMQFYIRSDWLAAGNLKQPTTLDELTTVLRYFKDGDPNGNGKKDEIPYIGTMMNSTGTVVSTLVLTAMGINADFSYEPHITADRKKIGIPVMEENYIHYLEYMNMLYSEGLLNSDLYSMSPDLKNAMIQKNQVGITQMYNPYALLGTKKEQYSVVEAQGPLTSAYNSERMWTISDASVMQGGIVVSYETKYPEAIIRMFDVYYGHDGDLPMSLMFWVGPIDCEGGTNFKCPYPVEGYDSMVYKYENESWTPYPPGGIDIWTYINNKLVPSTNCVTGLKYTESEVGKLFGAKQELPDFEMNWRNSMYKNVVPYEKLKAPILFLDPTSLNRVNEIAQPIVEYIQTKEAEFVTGVTPITEKNLKSVRDKLKKVGIDEYIGLVQEAYDAYLQNTAK